jgi:hypothetical protein
MQWIKTRSPKKPKKFKQTSRRKLVTPVLWGRKSVLMMEFMQQRTAITSEVCYETLKQLEGIIQNKMSGMLIFGIVFLHDNVRPYTAAHTRSLLEHFN